MRLLQLRLQLPPSTPSLSRCRDSSPCEAVRRWCRNKECGLTLATFGTNCCCYVCWGGGCQLCGSSHHPPPTPMSGLSGEMGRNSAPTTGPLESHDVGHPYKDHLSDMEPPAKPLGSPLHYHSTRTQCINSAKTLLFLFKVTYLDEEEDALLQVGRLL